MVKCLLPINLSHRCHDMFSICVSERCFGDIAIESKAHVVFFICCARVRVKVVFNKKNLLFH